MGRHWTIAVNRILLIYNNMIYVLALIRELNIGQLIMNNMKKHKKTIKTDIKTGNIQSP